MPDPRSSRYRHLTSLDGGALPHAPDEGNGAAIEPQVEASAASAPSAAPSPQVPPRRVGQADAFRREAELFRRVRAPGTILVPAIPRASKGLTDDRPVPAAAVQTEFEASGVDAHPSVPVPLPVTPSVRAAADVDLAARFAALAAPVAEASGQIDPGRLDDAFSRLRSGSEPAPLLLPTAALRRLAESEGEAAGGWVIALAGSLHRQRPGYRLDLAVDGRVLAFSSSADSTVFEARERRRKRSERDAVIRASAERLGQVAFGVKSPGIRGRSGGAALAAVAGAVHPVSELLEDGADVDPFCLWALVAAAIPAAPEGIQFTAVHLSEGSSVGAATVTVRPGRPLAVRRGESGSADIRISTVKGGALAWGLGDGGCASVGGSEELVEAVRRLIRSGFTPAARYR